MFPSYYGGVYKMSLQFYSQVLVLCFSVSAVLLAMNLVGNGPLVPEISPTTRHINVLSRNLEY
jgi:hypothetical protein